MDVENGRVSRFSSTFVESAQSQKDKFETLCYVKADISTAPYTSHFTTGNVGYKREYDIILLVGLTELKAQVSWIDSRTVRVHSALHIFICLTQLLLSMDTEDGEEVCCNVL